MIKKVNPFLCTFKKEIRNALKLVSSAKKVSRVYRPARGAKISLKETELIAELAFLKVFIAYEIFIEEVFIGYMLGAESGSGFTPKRYVFPTDRLHALRIAAVENARFTNWSDPDNIRNRAGKFFRDGEPFGDGVRLYITLLRSAKGIRHAIAHKSPNTKKYFEKWVRHYMGTIPSRDFSVGAFLLSPSSGAGSESYMEYFCEQLKAFSDKIAP